MRRKKTRCLSKIGITVAAAVAALGAAPGRAQIRNPVDNFIDMRAPEARRNGPSTNRAWNNLQDNCDRATSPSNCTEVETAPPPPPTLMPCPAPFYPPYYRYPSGTYCWYY